MCMFEQLGERWTPGSDGSQLGTRGAEPRRRPPPSERLRGDRLTPGLRVEGAGV